jgi:undecaprenyl-diphosphatase
MQQIDQSVFFFLNGLHSHFFDTFFWYATDGVIYLPLYLIAIWLAYKQFGKGVLMVLLFVIVIFLLSEYSCNFLKDTVCRLRPTQNPDIASLVHTVNDYRGGKYGFPSAHACNTFAVSLFLYRILRPKRWGVTATLFTWTALMSYSRIYLGVHYPGDILCGALGGVLIGWGMSALFRFLMLKIKKGERASSLF